MAESEKTTKEIIEKRVEEMSEVEKLDAGLEYNFWDKDVNARKLHAVEGCAKLNAIPVTDNEARDAAIRELFGSVDTNPTVLPTFSCDYGRNIHVGENFLANYNVTILPGVTIGNNVVIAAGAVVNKDVPDNCVVGGIPAKITRKIEDDTEDLPKTDD